MLAYSSYSGGIIEAYSSYSRGIIKACSSCYRGIIDVIVNIIVDG